MPPDPGRTHARQAWDRQALALVYSGEIHEWLPKSSATAPAPSSSSTARLHRRDVTQSAGRASLIEEADGSWPKPTGQELMALHEAYRTRQTNLRRESRHQLLAAGNADHYRAERRMPRLQRR